MGYDVDLVGSLLAAMRRSQDELRGISTTDPAGQNAMKNVADATGMLADHWIPFASGLLSCEAMTGYKPATIADGDLANDWLYSLVTRNGWRTTTDPLAPSDEPMTREQAAQLATWVIEHGDELDESGLVQLEERLSEIAASPSLTSAFLANLTPQEMTDLVNDLGDRRGQLWLIDGYDGGLSEPQTAELATIDALFVDLGRMIVSSSADNPDASTLELVAEMDPYAAALLVQHLRLSAEELAAVASSLIEREQQVVESLPVLVPSQARAADILMATILETPDGPSRFVVAVADWPALLLFSALDPQLANQILLEGTVPTVLSPPEQSVVIPAFLASIIDTNARTNLFYSEYNPEIFETTGALMAPYLVSLFTATTNPLEMSGAAKKDAENFVFDNPPVLQYFLDERERMSLAITGPFGVELDSDLKRITELSVFLATLDRLYSDGRIDAAERAQAAWELQWTIIGLLSIAAPNVVADIGVTAGTFALREVLESAGWGPADIEQVRVAATLDVDESSATIASMVAGLTFQTLLQRGKIPADAPPPPKPDLTADAVGVHYIESMLEWSQTNGLDPEAEAWVMAVSNAVLSPHEAGMNAAFRSEDDDD